MVGHDVIRVTFWRKEKVMKTGCIKVRSKCHQEAVRSIEIKPLSSRPEHNVKIDDSLIHLNRATANPCAIGIWTCREGQVDLTGKMDLEVASPTGSLLSLPPFLSRGKTRALMMLTSF